MIWEVMLRKRTISKSYKEVFEYIASDGDDVLVYQKQIKL